MMNRMMHRLMTLIKLKLLRSALTIDMLADTIPSICPNRRTRRRSFPKTKLPCPRSPRFRPRKSPMIRTARKTLPRSKLKRRLLVKPKNSKDSRMLMLLARRLRSWQELPTSLKTSLLKKRPNGLRASRTSSNSSHLLS